MSKKKYNCFLCDGKTIGSRFCFGCRVFICEDCTVNQQLMGFGHKPSDHLKCGECGKGPKSLNLPKWAQPVYLIT